MLRLLLIALIAGLCQADSINSDLSNVKVDRSVDISSQLVRITTTLTVENRGKTPVKSILFAIEPETVDHLAFFEAVVPVRSGETEKQTLTTSKVQVPEHKGKHFWKIDLQDQLSTGKTTQVEVHAIYTHLLRPYPSQIVQQEQQLMQYHGNQYFYSPYTTVTQTSKINLASSKVESYTKLQPVTQSDTVISYGPYENVAPFSQVPILVHSENNSPFLTVTNLLRTLEVSHWGNVAVEEHIDILHTGAFLKGPFSRYEYQREQSGASSVKSFKTMLPAAATDVYYRDEIGNISTSHLRVMDDSVEMDLRPRFPLFGGWKTHYTIGYNIPSYEYLFNSGAGDQYVLKIRLIDHIFDDMVVDDATVKVILPEGAKNIKLKAPYSVTRKEDELHFTYLDTFGRPVVTVKKSNLVEDHIQDLEIHYTFERYLMLQEPLLAVVALYLLFVLVIIYVRIDFSISKDELSESKMKLSSIAEQIQTHHEKRCTIYGKLDTLITQYKTQRDSAAFQQAIKKFNGELKNENQLINDLQTKLKTEGGDSIDKVSELQKHDRNIREHQANLVAYVEKVVNGKVGKQQYAEAELLLKKKIDDLVEKMEQLVLTL